MIALPGSASDPAPATDEPGARFAYEPLPDMGLPLADRLGQYPRQPDLFVDVLRAVGRRAVALLVRALFRLEVSGSVPDLPRVALVANHHSHLDTLAVLAALPERQRRRIAVFAARDYFFSCAHRAVLAALFGQGIAFDRSRAAELRRWTELLRQQPEGWFLAYPSGSRRSSEIHGGLLLVLARSGWPIVPVRVSGTSEAWPVGRAWPRPFRPLRIEFGQPLPDLAADDLTDALATYWERARA